MTSHHHSTQNRQPYKRDRQPHKNQQREQTCSHTGRLGIGSGAALLLGSQSPLALLVLEKELALERVEASLLPHTALGAAPAAGLSVADAAFFTAPATAAAGWPRGSLGAGGGRGGAVFLGGFSTSAHSKIPAAAVWR